MLRPYKIAALVFVVIAALAAIADSTSGWRTYTNHTLGASLKYPSDWKKQAGYNYRYSGSSGFFQIDATTGESLKIDQVARNEANHTLHPYGTAPSITSLKVAGRDARLIMPSEDQPKEMRGQAALIVKMPEPKCIGCQRFNYLMIWADKAHIRNIGSTVKFIKPEGRC